jgi:dodecin
MSVAKVVELVGSSNKSFQDAVDTAIQRASKTVRNIRGVDVVGQKAIVKSGKVTEYRVNLKLSFAVE